MVSITFPLVFLSCKRQADNALAPHNVRNREDRAKDRVKQDRGQNRLLFRKVRRANRQRDARMSCRGRQGEHGPIMGIGAAEHMSDGEAHKHERGDSYDCAIAD